MSLETIVTQLGYPGLVAGMLFEGETVLVLGAFMAHRGYLDLPIVILIALLIAFASDEFFFWAGRTKGRKFLEKRPSWAAGMGKAKSLLGRNPTLLYFGVRFMYGLRTVLPFVIGMSKADPMKFVPLNLLGSATWAVLFGMAGYLFGHFMELLFGDIHEYEHWIALGVVAVSACIWLIHRRVDRRIAA